MWVMPSPAGPDSSDEGTGWRGVATRYYNIHCIDDLPSFQSDSYRLDVRKRGGKKSMTLCVQERRLIVNEKMNAHNHIITCDRKGHTLHIFHKPVPTFQDNLILCQRFWTGMIGNQSFSMLDNSHCLMHDGESHQSFQSTKLRVSCVSVTDSEVVSEDEGRQ